MSGWENAPEYGSGGRPWVMWVGCVLAVLFIVGLATCLARAEPAAADLVGVASVIDGDTLEIHGTRVRLSGIDAPEHARRCGSTNAGQTAAHALDDLTQGRTVSCAVSGLDRYGRSVAACSVGGGDLAAVMVSQGWARDWPRYSHGAYADEQLAARRAARGVWGLGECPGLWGNRNYD